MCRYSEGVSTVCDEKKLMYGLQAKGSLVPRLSPPVCVIIAHTEKSLGTRLSCMCRGGAIAEQLESSGYMLSESECHPRIDTSLE